MKILLVVPRYELINKVNYDYQFPIGLAHISAAMKKAGHEVDGLNLNHLEGTIESLIKNKLDKNKYDVVTTGHIGIGFSIIEEIINSVRKHSSNPKVIIGGALITCETELMFNSLKPDFGVLGEGDATIVELLKCLEKKRDLKKVDGICYKDDKGNFVITKPRATIPDLDSLPFMDYEGVGFEEYVKNQSSIKSFHLVDSPREYTILCSRGCPYHCTFCYHPETRYRVRSLDNIFEELTIVVKKYKINWIMLQDDLFAVNRERVYEFCRRIKELSKEVPEGILWCCQLTVAGVDRELLCALKDSGCYIVSFGFESYSPKVLKSMRKPITPEQIDNAVKLAFEEKVGLLGNFIFGDVAETKKTAKETLDFWKNKCRGQIQIGFIQPYPGSEIYDRCIEKGIIKDRLDFIKNKLRYTNWINMTDSMTDKEVLRLKKDILEARRRYYPRVIPSKIKKIKRGRYDLIVKCHYCHEVIYYKDCAINNRFHFNIGVTCKNCHMRMYVQNRLYKLEKNYDSSFEFLRRKYLLFRAKILRKQI